MNEQPASAAAVVQPGADFAPDSAVEPQKQKKKEKKPKEFRGIETMFRVAFQNHVQMNQLADGKSGMLVSINGIIISVLIAFMAPRTGELSWELAPGLVLLAGGFASLTMAVFASRPRLNKGTFTLEDVRADRSSILFFGNFTAIPEKDFEEGMQLLIKDRKLLYNNLVRELYSLGKVLVVKYRYLKMAYSTFMWTLALSGLLLIFVMLRPGALP